MRRQKISSALACFAALGITTASAWAQQPFTLMPNSAPQGTQNLTVTATFANPQTAAAVTSVAFSGTGVTAGAVQHFAGQPFIRFPVNVAITAVAPAFYDCVATLSGGGTLRAALAFQVTLLPLTLTLVPNTGQQGQTLGVTANLNRPFDFFLAQFSFLPANQIAVRNLTPVSGGLAYTFTIDISPNAPPGPYTLVATPVRGQPVQVPNAFTVTALPPLTVVLAPSSGQQGQIL